jgi:hypothetical protein
MPENSTPPSIDIFASLETHRQLAHRYNVSTRTVDRWVDAGILPEPVHIRGRKYWPIDAKPQHDD